METAIHCLIPVIGFYCGGFMFFNMFRSLKPYDNHLIWNPLRWIPEMIKDLRD